MALSMERYRVAEPSLPVRSPRADVFPSRGVRSAEPMRRLIVVVVVLAMLAAACAVGADLTLDTGPLIPGEQL